VQARFEYTPADWRELQRYVRRRSVWLVWPLIVVAACFLLFALFLLLASPSLAPAPAPARMTTGAPVRSLVPLFPWALLVGAWVLSASLIRSRRGPRAMMTQAPALSGPMVADVDASGITLHGRLYRGQYQWEAVTRFRETKHLFLLFVTPVTALTLPKRGFATPEELEAMRAMGKKLSGLSAPGFPVVQSARDGSS
jgi:hypothetical protein